MARFPMPKNDPFLNSLDLLGKLLVKKYQQGNVQSSIFAIGVLFLVLGNFLGPKTQIKVLFALILIPIGMMILGLFLLLIRVKRETYG